MVDKIKTSKAKTGIWDELKQHQTALSKHSIKQLFEQQPDRATHHSIWLQNLFVDYSKNLFNEDTLSLLLNLADESGLHEAIENLFDGAIVNLSEQRPALHTALRSGSDEKLFNDVNIMTSIRHELQKVEQISIDLRSGQMLNANGTPFKTIINIGIGGSDLGPRMVVDALNIYAHPELDVRFVSNVDVQDIYSACKHANPETTLFILSSKSFTTLETLTNANTAKNWLIEHGCHEIGRHFIAITANQQAALDYGVEADRILNIWQWVGGRYSLWSAIGLPIAIAIGMDRFRDLLSGAELMDQHFRTADFRVNIPVILALLDVWYINFHSAQTLAVVPYDQSLQLLPDYLSQLMMESNGKNVTADGETTEHKTGAVVWGSVGTNAQHAFFQLLHQGTHFIPVDFLVALNSHIENEEHQQKLLANCFAQSEALMMGEEGPAETQPHRRFSGNHPSNTIVFEQLTPEVLGMLIALYEHRTYVQACIWNINPFDQWGVELGKKLSNNILQELESGNMESKHDPSTAQLIRLYLNKQ